MCSKITSVVSCLPSNEVSNNHFFDVFGEKQVSDTSKMTGVTSRYWSNDNQTTLDLCVSAAKHLDQKIYGDINECDALIFVTQTPDNILPGNAYVAQEKLGLSSNILCLDINSGCSGYVNGLFVANSLLAANSWKKILLLAGDTISKLVNPKDKGSAMIFGDAGTATIVEASSICVAPKFIVGSDGAGVSKLKAENILYRRNKNNDTITDYLQMDGSGVFNFTLKNIPKLIQKLAEVNNYSVSDFDYVLMHQANAFMLKHLTKKSGLSAEQVPININKFGNTSSASIPLLFCDSISERVLNEELICALMGFGVGFSWAAMSTTVGPLECAEVIYL